MVLAYLLHALLQMRRRRLHIVGQNSIASAILLYLDDLAQVGFVHPVLGLGQDLNIALAEAARVMVATSLALLLRNAIRHYFTLFEVG